MDVMKIARVRGVVRVKRNGERESRIIAIRLIWIPGMRPVMVPKRRPRRIAIVSCRSMWFNIYFRGYNCFDDIFLILNG